MGFRRDSGDLRGLRSLFGRRQGGIRRVSKVFASRSIKAFQGISYRFRGFYKICDGLRGF